MRLGFAATVTLVVCSAVTCIAQEATQLITPPGTKKVGDVASYGLGYGIGMNFASQGLTPQDLLKDEFLSGLFDALGGKEAAVDQQAVMTALEGLTGKIMERKLAVARKFLEENKKKDGVQVTDSGLQYKVIKSGNGASPTPQNSVVVHYEGRLVDGRVFDSSIRREKPETFQVTQLYKGWTEALLRMKVGDKWQLYLPPELGAPDGAQGAFGPNEALIFDVELLEVK